MHPVHTFLRGSEKMTRSKMGVSVRTELVDELETLVNECSDIGASRSEVVEAILTVYLQGDDERIEKTRELVIRNKKRSD